MYPEAVWGKKEKVDSTSDVQHHDVKLESGFTQSNSAAITTEVVKQKVFGEAEENEFKARENYNADSKPYVAGTRDISKTEGELWNVPRVGQ